MFALRISALNSLIGLAFLLAHLALPSSAAIATEKKVGLPPAPEWKGGQLKRGADGKIRRDSTAKDPLATITEGRRRVGIGSGFFVSRGGSVITNNHVIAGCRVITLETPWKTAGAATLVASDPDRDLALLKTDLTAPAAVTFRYDGRLEAGEILTIVGYPVRTLPPLSPQIENAVHTGRLAGQRMVTLNAAVAPGNSGGPALDAAGRLGAVITGEINTPAVFKQTGQLVRDVAIAIPADTTEEFLRENGIAVARSADRTPLDPTDLTALARQVVARIGCWR